MLDAKTIHAINRQVQARFPETADCQPRVRQQALPKSAAAAAERNYLVTYRTRAALSAGGFIERLIRVTVDFRGKILKISTSR